jgi:RNA polymerase sigma-70 factor (ECF subfamily)
VERVDTLAVGGVAPDPDEALALAARMDPAAFEELYVRSRVAVYRYLRGRTATRDEAAELSAVTFERAFRAIARYSPRAGGFRAWLLRIARNAAIDAARRERAGPIVVSDVGHESGPETRLIADESAEELRERVAKLPPDQRDALVLRYSSGLTAREIGAVLGKSEAASQKLLSRGLDALKEAYRVRLER